MFNQQHQSALLLLALIIPVALTGCVTSSEEPSNDTTSDLMPDAEGTTSYPLRLNTAWGETVLEERPTRIAAVTSGAEDAELLAALGVTPVLANDRGNQVWITEAVDGEAENFFTLNLDDPYPTETIASSEPDLIIALDAAAESAYPQLSKIAPVLGLEKTEDATDDWQDNIMLVGETLDLKDRAAEVITEHETWFDEFRQEHSAITGRTASYFVYAGPQYGSVYQSTPGSSVEELLIDIGFRANPAAANFAEAAKLSEEQYSLLDADLIILSNNAKDEVSNIVDNELFKSLNAVREGHFVLIDNSVERFEIDGIAYEGNLGWALASGGPLSSVWAAEKLGPVIEQYL